MGAVHAVATDVDSNRPNVLFIISDDMRPDLGCYGDLIAKTPHIDALAAAGVRFDRAYCQFPICNPSRASMLTGRHPTTTGVLGNRDSFMELHPDFVSLPRWFKENGYLTFRAGKIFHGGIDDPEAWSELPGPMPRTPEQRSSARDSNADRRNLTKAQYSDRWLVLEGEGENNGDYRNASRVIELLRREHDQPFFIGCGFSKPHSPLQAPQSCYDRYDLADFQLPVNFASTPAVPPGFPELSIRKKNADLFIGREATPDAARDMIRAYRASISYVDDNVGRVLAELDRQGLRENTVILFWGDHGYQLGERGKWSKAGSLFEMGARVPLIIAAPGAAGNGRPSPRVVQSIDLYPTLVDLCGLPQPDGLEGSSLQPLLNNPDTAWDHPAFTVWSENGRDLLGISVCDERWRYAEFNDGEAMLFDHGNDPLELTNVVNKPEVVDVRARLSALVKDYSAHEGHSR